MQSLFERLTNESHPTHISGKVVDMLASRGDFQTVLENAEVRLMKLMAELGGCHELVHLPVSCDHIEALLIVSR